jgi:hypothetical protein
MTPEELQELAELEEMERLEAQLGANKTPYPIQKQPLMMRGGPVITQGPEGPETIDMRSEADKQLAAKGVNPDYKLPIKESIIQGLATNSTEKEAFINSYLQKAYPNVPTRKGDTGEIEFLDPATKRWTVAYPGAAALVSELPEAVLSTVGAAVGSLNPVSAAGGPAGMAVGGAFGAGIGQLAGDVFRQKMGQAFGINQTQNMGSMASDAVPEAVATGAIDLGTTAIYGAGRGVKTWLFGRQILKPEEAQSLLNAQMHSDALVKEINSKAGVNFNPTTAQRGAQFFNEPAEKMLTAESQAKTDPFIGNQLAANQTNNERALDQYFDAISLNQRLAGVTTPGEGGERLRLALDAEQQGAKANAGQALAALPANMDKGAAGRSIRETLAARYNAAKLNTDNAYAEYKTLINETEKNPSTIAVPWTLEVRTLQKQFEAAMERSPRLRSKQSREALMLDTKQPVNLSDLDDLLKDLRNDIRQGTKGKLDVPLNLRDAKRLEKSLTNMRNKYLEDNEPEAYQALLKAEKAQTDEANTFRYGLTKNLLTQESKGKYKITDAGVITRIMKNQDAAAAKEIAEIVKSNPDAMLATQQFLFAQYRRAVDPKRAMIPNVQNHKKFMEKYGDVVKEFFTPEQAAKLDQLGEFADIIAGNTRTIKALNKVWAKDFAGRLKSFSAEDLTEAVNGKFDVDEVRKLKTLANAYGPDVVKSWQAGVAQDLRQRIFKGDNIDPSRLQALVSDGDRMRKLGVVFGPKYIQDLNTLNDAMKMITHISRNIDRFPKNTLFTDIARATIAPPLGREGRIVTLGQNNRARSFMNNVYQALNDPEYLSEMASRTARTMRTVAGVTTATTAYQKLRDMQHDER